MTSPASESGALEFRIRDAVAADAPTIVAFNAAMAWETERKQLDSRVLTASVAAALADPDRLRYWVAETRDDPRVIGQAAVTREWSDWRHGWIWWLQSVYVAEDARRRGVFCALHRAIRDDALARPDVIGLRLYVEVENHTAQATYRRLGMSPGGYHVYEEIWAERFNRAASDVLG